MIVKGNNRGIFFIKFLAVVTQPIVYILTACFIWKIIFRNRKRKNFIDNTSFNRSRVPSLRSKIRVTSVIIIYILQPGIIKSTFQLFKYFYSFSLRQLL